MHQIKIRQSASSIASRTSASLTRVLTSTVINQVTIEAELSNPIHQSAATEIMSHAQVEVEVAVDTATAAVQQAGAGSTAVQRAQVSRRTEIRSRVATPVDTKPIQQMSTTTKVTVKTQIKPKIVKRCAILLLQLIRVLPLLLVRSITSTL